MSNFIPKAFLELERLMHPVTVDRMKDSFIQRIKAKYVQQEDFPETIDNEQGILTYLKNNEKGYVEIKFEEEYKETLWEATESIKSEIDSSVIKLTEKERIKYWRNLLHSIEKIKKNRKETIRKFTICKKAFHEVENYLYEKYNFQIDSNFRNNPVFNLKSKYTDNDLRNIFQFITDNGFIDDEIYDFDDFLHILFDKESRATLNFVCKTQTVVYFLENLSGLFSNMTRKEIEKSGRFITKQGEILTETNYGAAISRTKNKKTAELQKTEKFFLENFSQ